MTYPAGPTTSHIRTTPGAGGGGPVAGISLPDVEQLLWVDLGAAGIPDGTRQNPFHTVEDAVTAANALTPGTNNRVLIMIMPGTYVETAALAPDAFVYFSGTCRATCIIQRTGTLFNIDDAPVEVWNLTLEETGGLDPILDIDAAGPATCEFHECRIISPDDANATDVASGALVFFVDCELDSGHPIVDVLTMADSGDGQEVTLLNCQVTGVIDCNGGSLFCYGMTLSGHVEFGGEDGAELVVQDCAIINATTYCIRFVDAAQDVATLENNWMSSPDGSFEVDGSGEDGYVAVKVHNNVMQEGFSDFISPSIQERFVGQAGDRDFHKTLPDALASIIVDSTTIFLLKDVTLTAEEGLPSFILTIECNEFTITGDGDDLFDVGDDTKKTIANGSLLGYIVMDSGGDAFDVEIRNVEMAGTLAVTTGAAGSLLRVNQSRVIGRDDDDYALILSDADPEVIVEYSRMSGFPSGEGSEHAILYDTVTNDELKIRHSTIYHGNWSTNAFERSGAQTPDFVGHHNCFGTDPTGPGWLTNLVAAGQEFDTIDQHGDF